MSLIDFLLKKSSCENDPTRCCCKVHSGIQDEVSDFLKSKGVYLFVGWNALTNLWDRDIGKLGYGYGHQLYGFIDIDEYDGPEILVTDLGSVMGGGTCYSYYLDKVHFRVCRREDLKELNCEVEPIIFNHEEMIHLKLSTVNPIQVFSTWKRKQHEQLHCPCIDNIEFKLKDQVLTCSNPKILFDLECVSEYDDGETKFHFAAIADDGDGYCTRYYLVSEKDGERAVCFHKKWQRDDEFNWCAWFGNTLKAKVTKELGEIF
jgi:hypothetical protein